MKTIKVKKLTKEAFAPYGDHAHHHTKRKNTIFRELENHGFCIFQCKIVTRLKNCHQDQGQHHQSNYGQNMGVRRY